MRSSTIPNAIQVIDSHTGGEPTRVVIAGGPDLGDAAMDSRRDCFARDFDDFRNAVVNEPRGSDVLVGAILCSPEHADSVSGVIFFNNVGYLGMCVHGMIGVVVTLAHLGRIATGSHRFDTPVGTVTVTLEPDGRVGVTNIPSYRYRRQVAVDVPGYGMVCGDVAWGGNWFFLVDCHEESIRLDNVERLTDVAWRIGQALASQGITAADRAVIDHVEFFGPPEAADADSKNFVLCPGKAYDRSPCGTGTSAKLACLIADGKLKHGHPWRQEGILGSIFEARADLVGGQLLPTIHGTAHVISEARLIIDPRDPLRMGIRR